MYATSDWPGYGGTTALLTTVEPDAHVEDVRLRIERAALPIRAAVLARRHQRAERPVDVADDGRREQRAHLVPARRPRAPRARSSGVKSIEIVGR